MRSLAAGLVLALIGTAASAEPNLSGNAWMGVRPVQVDGTPWAEFMITTGAMKLTPTNGFGAFAGVVTHKYYRLTVDETAQLAAGLRAWVDAPHSDSVFSSFEDSIGMSFAGNAWSETLQPVVVVSITAWVQQGRGHIHGGHYFTLTKKQALLLAASLEGWVDNPVPGAMIYSRLVQ